MQYPYQISTRQLSVVTHPRHDFAAKHICREMLHYASSFVFLKES